MLADSGPPTVEPWGRPADRASPELVAGDRVLDTPFEVRVVVDLDQEDAVPGLLGIHSVEPVAYEPRCPYARIDDPRGASSSARVRKPPSILRPSGR